MIEQTMQPGILNKEEADLMYAGIMLDTKQFVRNTGVRTFSAALFLRGEGAMPSDAQALFKTDLGDFLSEAQYESAVSLYREHFAFAVSESDGSDPGVRLAASKAADKLLSVSGIKASFALCPMGEDVRISARSDGEINVQRIMEHLGGGGHFDAAAAMLKATTMPQAIDLLKEAIDN
jgi:c-di-AMP phosphodiesterase-like protein